MEGEYVLSLLFCSKIFSQKFINYLLFSDSMYKNPHAHERDVLASVVDLLLADSVVGQQVRERVLEHSVREMVQTVGELDPRLIVKLAVKHLDSHPFVRSAYEQLLKEYKDSYNLELFKIIKEELKRS